MTFRNKSGCALLVLAVAWFTSDAWGQSNRIYWTEIGQTVTRIRSSALNGANVQTLLFDPVGAGTGNADLGFPTSITVDQAAEQFYFVDFGRDRISRANLDGTSLEILVQLPAAANMRAVALHPSAGDMYFTNWGDDTINRVSMNGGVHQSILQLPSASIPLGLSLDVTAGHVYFTDNGLDRIRRVNMDGTGLIDLVTTGLDSPVNVQLDLMNGKMYWVDFGVVTIPNSGRIQRANLDGTDVETLLSNLPLPEDISLDVLSGKFYWTDGIADVINRANLDGTGVETILTSANGLDLPFALTVDVFVPEPAVPGIVFLLLFTALRRRQAR